MPKFYLDSLKTPKGDNRYCGPYILAKLLEISTDDIANMILKNRCDNEGLYWDRRTDTDGFFEKVVGTYKADIEYVLKTRNIKTKEVFCMYDDLESDRLTLVQTCKKYISKYKDGVYIIDIGKNRNKHLALIEVNDGNIKYYDSTFKKGATPLKRNGLRKFGVNFGRYTVNFIYKVIFND